MTLKDGLQSIVAKVQALPDGTMFDMGDTVNCVIGTLGLWTHDHNGYIDYPGTLKTLFGIVVEERLSPLTRAGMSILGGWPAVNKAYIDDFLFVKEHMQMFTQPAYTEEQWNVVKIFTDMGGHLRKENWLSRAYIQLEKLK